MHSTTTSCGESKTHTCSQADADIEATNDDDNEYCFRLLLATLQNHPSVRPSVGAYVQAKIQSQLNCVETFHIVCDVQARARRAHRNHN